MKVVYAIPSADSIRANAVSRMWRIMGYETAVLLNGEDRGMECCADTVFRENEYRGWASSVNWLCEQLDADIVVTGGDDVFPDPTRRASTLAREFAEHFAGTDGVMQPTGDRWDADGQGSPISERICGSPWLGREFIRRMNGKPLHDGYHHWFADQELCEVTKAAGLLWQRPELTQHHRHWARDGGQRPEYMERARLHWQADHDLFHRRRAAGFLV